MCTGCTNTIFFLIFFSLGKRAYNFDRATRDLGYLPSPATVLDYHLQLSALVLHEVGLSASRCLQAKQFFKELRYLLPFFHLCTDALDVRKAITWRRIDNVIVGLATLVDVRCPQTIAQLIQLIAKYGIATHVNVLVLVPLDPAVPPPVLAVFPQVGKPVASTYLQRWAVANDMLADVGLFVVSHDCDGDSAQLRAETRRQHADRDTLVWHGEAVTQFTGYRHARTVCFGFHIPLLVDDGSQGYISAPARHVTVQLPSGVESILTVPDLCFQDFCHLATKLHVRILGRDGHGVRIGCERAAIEKLATATAGDSDRATLGLHAADFDPACDPMNVPAFFRLFSERVVTYLESMSKQLDPPLPPASVRASFPPPAPTPPIASSPTTYRGLLQFIVLARRAVLAFLEPGLDVLGRITMAWYAAYFVWGWREDSHRRGEMSTEFITAN